MESDDTQQTNVVSLFPELNMYEVVVSYLEPVLTVLHVRAQSELHARAGVMQNFADIPEFEIMDISKVNTVDSVITVESTPSEMN